VRQPTLSSFDGGIGPVKSASVYERVRFTWTKTGISNKCSAKSVAGLPTQIVNDKGRYRQLACEHRWWFPQTGSSVSISRTTQYKLRQYRDRNSESMGFLPLTSFIIPCFSMAGPRQVLGAIVRDGDDLLK
jgi:hypothetical protein